MRPGPARSFVCVIPGIFSALALLAVVHASLAQTVEAPRAGKRERTRAEMLGFRLRIHGLFGNWTLVNLGERGEEVYFSIAGGSAAIEVMQLLTVELAGGYLPGISGDLSSEWSVRAGPVPLIYDGRNDESAGWVLQVPALLAYRYLDRSGEQDGCPGHEKTHNLAVNVGLEATRWSSPWFAWSVRWLVGITGPVAQNRTGCPAPDDLDYALDSGVQFGIAF